MSPEHAIYVSTQVVWFIIVTVVALITPSLVVGLVVAIIQAVTQVNEQTLSFLPRLLITLVTIALLSHWMFSEFVELFNFIVDNIRT